MPLDRVTSAKVPGGILKIVREVADANDRTTSGQIRHILKEWAEAQSHQR